MDAMNVALLTLAALLVGMFLPVMAQLYFTLRQVRMELHETRARLDPVLDRLNSAANLSTALAVAVTAGIKAFRESSREDAAPQEEAP
jgi:hypothetical protein